MSPLTLTLRQPPRQRIDLAPVHSERLAGLSAAQIGQLELIMGNRRAPLEELFEVAHGDPQHLVIANSCERLDGVGTAMAQGRIVIHGNVGSYLGKDMRGGTIEVHGNAGDWTASGMRAGEIRIHGDAGPFLGGALPGERYGMRGGTVIVSGSAGDRVGDRMRRGVILIAGEAADYCGARMLAGTVAVLGAVGDHVGFAMKRGTIFLAQAPERLGATFNDCGEHELTILALLLRAFARAGGTFADLDSQGLRVRRYAGDLASLGKGEVLVWCYPR